MLSKSDPNSLQVKKKQLISFLFARTIIWDIFSDHSLKVNLDGFHFIFRVITVTKCWLQRGGTDPGLPVIAKPGIWTYRTANKFWNHSSEHIFDNRVLIRMSGPVIVWTENLLITWMGLEVKHWVLDMSNDYRKRNEINIERLTLWISGKAKWNYCTLWSCSTFV